MCIHDVHVHVQLVAAVQDYTDRSVNHNSLAFHMREVHIRHVYRDGIKVTKCAGHVSANTTPRKLYCMDHRYYRPVTGYGHQGKVDRVG